MYTYNYTILYYVYIYCATFYYYTLLYTHPIWIYIDTYTCVFCRACSTWKGIPYKVCRKGYARYISGLTRV